MTGEDLHSQAGRDALYNEIEKVMKAFQICPECKAQALTDVLAIHIRSIHEHDGTAQALEIIGKVVTMIGMHHGVEAGTVTPIDYEVREMH